MKHLIVFNEQINSVYQTHVLLGATAVAQSTNKDPPTSK